MKIESRIGKVKYPAEKIYNFASNFRNFNNIIPQDQVNNWYAEEEHCSFSVNMLGAVELRIVEKEAFKLVKINTNPAKSSQNFTLWIQIKEIDPIDSRIKITIEPKVNLMMQGMVKGPLKKFVDSLVDQIEKFRFND